MVQTLTPTSDLHVGAWRTNTGASTGLHAALADISDANYIESEMTAPQLSLCGRPGHRRRPGVLHRARRVVGASQRRIGDVQHHRPTAAGVRLGGVAGTLVASWTTSGVPGTFTAVTQTLTAPQADAITNYAALSLRFVADEA